MTSPRTGDGDRWSLIAILDRIRLAGSFLTILPLLDRRQRSSAEVAASFGWFPLIGFAIGAGLCLEDRLIAGHAGAGVRAVFEVMTLAALTGAVHLDGLADTADALSARGDRTCALAIMRDSHIGTFGAVALFFVLALKIAALVATRSALRSSALFLAPGMARAAMVMVAYRLDYLRADGGAGAALLPNDAGSLRTAIIIAMLGALIIHTLAALAAMLIAIAVALLLRAFYRRWLGGVTGDLLGAAGEVVETVILLTLALL